MALDLDYLRLREATRLLAKEKGPTTTGLRVKLEFPWLDNSQTLTPALRQDIVHAQPHVFFPSWDLSWHSSFKLFQDLGGDSLIDKSVILVCI
jgi:hypothetical protein